jgi:hypothetical protein
MSKAHYLLNCIITFCFIQLSVVNLFAQTLKFQKVYGGYSYDYGNDLIQTPDTGYLLLCTSNSFSSSSDIYLLKVDKLGAYQWQHTYGGTEIEGACKIKLTQDGNIAMAGHTSSYLSSSYDFYLVKANMNGDTIWTKHYGTNEWDFANSMDTCADGGFILAGKTYETGNAYSDILIVKTDADGNQQWQKKIGGLKDEVANSIISISDGFLICGTTSSNGSGGSDIYVCKLDLNGTLIWENYYGNEFNDEGTGIYLSIDNSIVFSGNRTTPVFPSNFNTYIRKIRYDGTTYWAFPNSTNSIVNNITNCIIEGFNNRVTTIGAFDLNSPGINDCVIYLWDSTANYVQSGTHGGSFEDYGKSIIKTSDYGYAAIGTTNSFGMGLSNIYFIKIDTIAPSTGNLSIFVNLEESHPLVATQNQPFPNPFSNSTSINIDFPVSLTASDACKLNVFDQLGRDVSQQVSFTLKENNKGSIITLNNLNLGNGLYFYHLKIDERSVAQGKFTIIK